ncbi:MAG: hypothetical protein V1933_06645 [Candidatus Omnitrophota bacterium]
MNNCKEYGLLKTVGILFKIFAVLALVVGLISFILILFGGSKAAAVSRTVSIIWLVAGALYATIFIMLSEIIKVLIRIEYNTRKAESAPVCPSSKSDN